MTKTFVMACSLTMLSAVALSQETFQDALRALSSADARVRLRAVQALRSGGTPDAAVPLASAVIDTEDAVQLEAIAAELNLFLAEKVVPRRRVGLIIEVRGTISAEAVFSAGPFALSTDPAPRDVVTALERAARDDNSRVAVEALYAFGALGSEFTGSGRRELLRTSASELAGSVGVPDSEQRLAALRVIGRLFARRSDEGPVDSTVGDSVVAALNDKNPTIRDVAMDALGAMRYERGVQALSDLALYYGRKPIGISALTALSRIGHASSTSIFVQLLSGGNDVQAGIAIEGLARLGDRRQDAAIQAAVARERNEGVRLARSFASVSLGSGPLDPIVGALEKSRLREQAMRYLIELAPGRAGAFAVFAGDDNPRRRADVADILGLSHDPAAIAVVEPLTRDRDPLVARSAFRAVARLRRPA